MGLCLLVSSFSSAEAEDALRSVARAEVELEVGRGADGVWLVRGGEEPKIYRWRESGPGGITTSTLPGFGPIRRVESLLEGPAVYGRSGEDEVAVALRGNRLVRLPRQLERASRLWLERKKPWAALAEMPAGRLQKDQVWWRGGWLSLPAQAHAVPGASPDLGPLCERMIPTAMDADPAAGRIAVALAGCSREETAELAVFEQGKKAPLRIPIGAALHPGAVVLEGGRAVVLAKRDDLATFSALLPFEVDLAAGKARAGPALPVRALEVQAADSAPGRGLWARIVVEAGTERMVTALWQYDGGWREVALRDPAGRPLEPVSQAVDPLGHLWVTARHPPGSADPDPGRFLLTDSPWPKEPLLFTPRGAVPDRAAAPP